jgi:hypothetical protein
MRLSCIRSAFLRVVFQLLVFSLAATLLGITGCSSGQSAIQITSLQPDMGIVLMRRHESPDRLVWVSAAFLQMSGDLHLADERGRFVPGVTIPQDFSSIRIDSAGRVYAASGKSPLGVVGRVIVVSRSKFDATVQAHPNPLDALEVFWREEPEDVRVLHVGTPAK